MNNLKKVGLTALAGALVSVSANAADLSVTGGASIGFFGEEKQSTGNGWYMNDGITFGASEELDNGMTVSLSFLIDSSDTVAAAGIDNRSIKIDMGDSGTLTFSGDGGDSVLSAIDDKMPTAYEEAWDLVTGADTNKVGGPGSNNMWHYSNSSLMDGVTVSASHTPSGGATQVESSSDYGVSYTGIDGLTVMAAAGENNAAAASLDITNMYVTYAMDAFTVGYQTAESDSETASADVEHTILGISYAVSEDMSVSLGSSTMEFEDSSKSDQESTGISVSYTTGSMTIAASHNTVDNVGGTATDDRSAYDLNLVFAF
jgi:outer membrane protein OmpU